MSCGSLNTFKLKMRTITQKAGRGQMEFKFSIV